MARRWSSEEQEKLIKLFKEGIPPQKIAKELGRKLRAVTERYHYILGYTKKRLLSEKMANKNREHRNSTLKEATKDE